MKTQTHSQACFTVPAKLFRIGELVRYTPFSRQTIHNYTIMGLIQESEWSQGGHRLYDETVFARLSKIVELRKTMTLTQIRRMLSQEDGSSVAASADEISRPANESVEPNIQDN
jgi:DNA-binding transcriptional MerR regulator